MATDIEKSKVTSQHVPPTLITSNSRPVEILVQIESIFRTSTMDCYGNWMSNVRDAILGTPDVEAARNILRCYSGWGSLLDIAIQDKRFYELRDELHAWAVSAIPGVPCDWQRPNYGEQEDEDLGSSFLVKVAYGLFLLLFVSVFLLICLSLYKRITTYNACLWQSEILPHASEIPLELLTFSLAAGRTSRGT